MTTAVTTRAGKGARLTATEVDANFNTVATAIDTEIAARGTAVSGEASTRASADSTLASAVTSEASARATADALLVAGPASVTDGHLAVFDGTTGKLLKDGGAVPAGSSGAALVYALVFGG